MSGSERAAALPQWARAAATWRDALLVTWAVARRDRFALAGLIIYAVLLPMAIVLVAFLGPSIWNTVLVMTLLLWRDTGRVIRAQVLSLRTRSYVEAARVLGASHVRTMFVHIAPNVLPLSFLYGSLAVGWAILTEASISFLGFGDPNVISWGFMLQDAYNSQAMARHAFYWFVPPGLCIMLAVMAGFFIGRGYEELLFPRLRRR